MKMWLRAALLDIVIFAQISKLEGFWFSQINTCTCLGQELTFECTVDGDGATYWQGTALQECSNNRVIIRHSQHHTRQSTTEECGSTGTVVGTPVSAVNMSFSSQLTVNVSQHLNGSTIECVSDGRGYFGSSQILLSSGFIMPLTIIVSNVSGGQLNFTWSPVIFGCTDAAFHYEINTTSCGKCTDGITSSNFVTCIIPSTLSGTCTVTVKTKVYACGTRQVSVSHLRVPFEKIPDISTAEIVETFPIIKTTFSSRDATNTSLSINFPTIFYNLSYTDSFSGISCGSAIVPSSSCVEGICRHLFELFSPACHNTTKINVSVSATNVLGRGTQSHPVTINLVQIEENQEKDIVNVKSNSQCSHVILVVSTGIASALVISIMIVIFMCVIVMLIKDKAKLKKELEGYRCKESEVKIIYEEIRPIKKQPSPDYNTQDNIAYWCAKQKCI